MIILVPSYEPDHKLVDLIETVIATPAGHQVLVVNDGSDPRFDPVFEQVRLAGATVIEHHPNRGKGYALKRGFDYIAAHCPDQDVVCADSDGQHTPEDIFAVAHRLQAGGDCVVLGARSFTGEIPLRSRFGNAATRVALRATSGLRLQDTQTGLRGYPASLLSWLMSIDGDRFEYELNVLLEARRSAIEVVEVPIATVYIDDNASSHFRPVIDSIRVYLPLVRFSISSLAAAAVDFVLVLALMAMTGNLAVAVVGARISSATLNFTLNRRYVFDPAGRTSLPAAIAGYGTVAIGILIANYTILYLLYERLGIMIGLAKIVTEASLFLASYFLQKHFVFRTRRPQAGTDPHRRHRPVGSAPTQQ